MIAVARAYGVSKILAFDILQNRVDFAKTFGADYTALGAHKDEGPGYPEWAQAFKTKTLKEAGVDSWGVDVAVEASGAESAMHAGIAFVHNGGTCMFLVTFILSLWTLLTINAPPDRCPGGPRQSDQFFPYGSDRGERARRHGYCTIYCRCVLRPPKIMVCSEN